MLLRRPRAAAAALAAIPLFAWAACGGNVVVDHGEGGDGGAPHATSTSASMGTTTTTNVHTTTSSFMSSTSSGSECDGHGECGDSQSGCVGCALNGPCFDALSKCQETQDCIDFAVCIDGCSDPGCTDMCAAQFPEGASLYNDVIFCVICEQCPSDCDGPGSGCP